MENEKRPIDAKLLCKKPNEPKSLIDPNALWYRICKIADEHNTEHIFIDVLCDEINNAPTVDAVEVVHGRWIWSEENECWVCNNCEMAALNNYRGNSTDSNYCPNCGAKMDGDGNDN